MPAVSKLNHVMCYVKTKKISTFESEMNAEFTYRKDKITKWLLTVALFFSVFSFSGYAGNYQLKNQQTTQVELVVSGKYKVCKRTISYLKAFEIESCNDSFIRHCKDWKAALLFFNERTKAKLNYILRQFILYKSADYFLHIKTIPTNSDEDIFVTFIR
jgi:hypothetical protein